MWRATQTGALTFPVGELNFGLSESRTNPAGRSQLWSMPKVYTISVTLSI